MLLSDFGATVTRIDRIIENPLDPLAKGKRTLAINIKNAKGQELARALSIVSDVVIEPYRPGVMEKLNLGPELLLKENPKLIYARLTGFGQTGKLASRAGHDINYIAVSGILSLLGKRDEPPSPPVNLIADFAGGGLLCAFGILTALLERHRSGKGQIIDCSMTEGAAYVSSWLTRSQQLPIWSSVRGDNMLDGGTFFYGTYETSDGKYMSVGALEPQFYQEFTDVLGLRDVDQFDENQDAIKKEVARIFKTKTQKEWSDLFEDVDACVFPVIDLKSAHEHPHNRERKAFVEEQFTDGLVVPAPAPILSRTPATSSVQKPNIDYISQVGEILGEIGLNAKDIKKLQADGALILPPNSKL